MKKKIFLFTVALVCLFSCLASPLYAETTEALETVCVTGKSKITVKPDTAEISFGIQKRAETIEEGQQFIISTIDNIKSAITILDENATINLHYSSTYPVCEHGIQAFEFNYTYTIKTKTLDKVNEMIIEAGKAGAVRFNDARLCLENEDEAYTEALKSAKQNAITKASALHDNLMLKEICEQSVYSYYSSYGDGDIVIEACIKATFETEK